MGISYCQLSDTTAAYENSDNYLLEIFINKVTFGYLFFLIFFHPVEMIDWIARTLINWGV